MRMAKALNLAGSKFGRLTVLSKAGVDKRGCIVWECVCDCGKKVVVNGAKLKNGHTKSCGCLVKDHGSRITHGGTKTRLYRIWRAMKNRCYNEKFALYRYYGGRGIAVCDEWRNSFEAFRSWAVANGYSDELSIDRIDANGHYSPENCRWATMKEQNINTRRNKKYEYNGQSYTLKEWSELLGINYQTLHSRVVALGWGIERALSEGGCAE